MRIEDMLDKDTREKLNRTRNNEKKNKSINNYQAEPSHREVEGLMGVNRPTYKRCRGSYRQKYTPYLENETSSPAKIRHTIYIPVSQLMRV